MSKLIVKYCFHWIHDLPSLKMNQLITVVRFSEHLKRYEDLFLLISEVQTKLTSWRNTVKRKRSHSVKRCCNGIFWARRSSIVPGNYINNKLNLNDLLPFLSGTFSFP